jgi:hypothetical protein
MEGEVAGDRQRRCETGRLSSSRALDCRVCPWDGVDERSCLSGQVCRHQFKVRGSVSVEKASTASEAKLFL